MRRLGRRLALAMLLSLAAVPGMAQEAVTGTVLDLRYETTGFVLAVIDLVYKVEDLKGAARDLEVKESATEIRIELAADVLFDFDKATLRAEAVTALRTVAGIIREHPGRKVRIEGHTDAKGSDSYNQKLSERRAASVRDWLVKEAGLPRAGFTINGLGETRPAVPNSRPDGSDDPEGRQKNRRVEIIVAKR